MNFIKRFSIVALTVISIPLVAVKFSVVNFESTPIYYSINGGGWQQLFEIKPLEFTEQVNIAFSTVKDGSQYVTRLIIDPTFEKTCFIKVRVDKHGGLKTVTIEPQSRGVKQQLSKEQAAKIKGTHPKGKIRYCTILKPLDGNITQEEIASFVSLAESSVNTPVVQSLVAKTDTANAPVQSVATPAFAPTVVTDGASTSAQAELALCAQENLPEKQAIATQADDKGKEPLEFFDGSDSGNIDPLLEAVITNQPFAIIQKLIFAGANPNIQEAATQKAPLHYAVENENNPVIQLLLETPNINVNIQDSDKNTPLHLAAKIGNLPIVRLLLQAPNINILAQNINGESALKIASDCQHSEVLYLLGKSLTRSQFIQLGIKKIAKSLWHIFPNIIPLSIPVGIATLFPNSDIGKDICDIGKKIGSASKQIGIALPYLYMLSNLYNAQKPREIPIDDQAMLKDTENKTCSISLENLIKNDPALRALSIFTRALKLDPSKITILLGQEGTGTLGNTIYIAKNFNRSRLTSLQKIGSIGHELCHISDKFEQKNLYATALAPFIADGTCIGTKLFSSHIYGPTHINEHLASCFIPRIILGYGFNRVINYFLGRYYEKRADVVSARLVNAAQSRSDLCYNVHLLEGSVTDNPLIKKVSTFLYLIDTHPASLERAGYFADIAINEQGINQQDLMLHNPALTRTKMAAGEPNFTLYIDNKLSIDSNRQDSMKRLDLLRTTIPINAYDEQHRTALMYAIINRDITTVRRLLQEGASINHHDINVWTPLHWAATLGNPYIMQALLVHGARLHEKNNTLQTPYDIAKKFHHSEAIELLASSSKSQKTSREQLFTLTCTHHRRLGENSPVALLHSNLLAYIGTLVKQANYMHDLASYSEHEENLWNTLRNAITHNDKDTVQAMLDNNTVVRPSESFQLAAQYKNYDIADMLEPHAIIKRDFDRYLHASQ